MKINSTIIVKATIPDILKQAQQQTDTKEKDLENKLKMQNQAVTDVSSALVKMSQSPLPEGRGLRGNS